MRKRIWILAICLMLLVSCLSMGAVAENNGDLEITKVEMPSKTVKAGETFTVTVNMKNDVGLKKEEPASLEIHRVPKTGELDNWFEWFPFEKVSSGVYQSVITVDNSMKAGNYEIIAIYTYAEDESKEQYYLYKGANDEKHLLPDNTVAIVTDNTDATGPVISKVDVKSQTVKEGDTVSVTVYAKDDSGIPTENIGEAKMYRQSETDDDWYIERTAEFKEASPGKYTATFQIDENWVSGKYLVNQVTVNDVNGNTQDMIPYVEIGPNKYKENDKFHETFITVDTKCKDAIPPKLIKTDAQTKVVRIGETYSLIIHATDESGLAKDEPGQVIFLAFEGEGPRTWKSADLVKQSEGVYKATFQIDEDWLLQSYYLASVELTDKYGNNRSVSPNLYDPVESCPWTVIQIAEKDADVSKIEIDDPASRDYEEYRRWQEERENQTGSNEGDSSNGNRNGTVTSAEVAKVVEKYSDIPEKKTWFTEGVSYAVTKGYMAGTASNNFDPNGKVTRAQIAQILYAAEEKPTSYGDASFKDVSSGKWYSNAVIWAANCGIVSGYPDKTFRPNDEITREQMVAIMYKYTQMKGYNDAQNGDLSKFSDQNKISKYAIQGMKWAVGHGVISGTKVGIEPKGLATRAQVAVILQSYDKNVRK